MGNIIDEKRAKINELQKLAKEVQLLKSEHRQKRPIVIEFSGSPKAGKTSCINALELFLKRNDFKVKVIQERASVCPVSDKQSPMFNFWTSCMSISGMIGTLEDKNNNVDVLILDRGIFDALCWFEWLVSTSKMESEQRDIAEKFFLMDDFVKPIDVVFAFCTKPEISIQREYANLLTDKLGTIMNHKVLGEYLNAIERTIKNKKKSFHNVFKVDTSNMTQDDVNFEVTQKTLRTLKDLLMERIGYFHKTNEILDVIATQSVISFEKLNSSLPRMKFDLREIVENNGDLLQPIPIAVIANLDKTKVIAIKKNKKAVSDTSPEKDKLLPYVGGHSRYEDQVESDSDSFISICKTTLKREIKEEIGISVALDSIKPIFIYTQAAETSKNHLAICFVVSVDEDSVKLRLDTQELILNRGKSKSGRFIEIRELHQNQDELEEWGKIILKEFFDLPFEQVQFDFDSM